MGFPSGSVGKEPACNARDARDMGSILGQEDPLEEGTATHSSILAWRFLWTEEPGKPQSTGCKELNTSEATEHSTAAVSFKKTQQIFTFHCKVCGKQNLSMYVFIY